ncbi:hypothetical protein DBV15_02661 [Temnothorax longispinosus]|uniref:Uncharacterized protein n=1 Tax=Temnothorax longispinosus TaxID=300112 RepID=A0A4S2K9S4_9HYME|nr:hypothetical protein DBV15_02661 [Temnothorax longispinosus]
MSCVSISPSHAESSLRIMESYLHKQQLTDVTLIAGKCTRPLPGSGMLFVLITTHLCVNCQFDFIMIQIIITQQLSCSRLTSSSDKLRTKYDHGLRATKLLQCADTAGLRYNAESKP